MNNLFVSLREKVDVPCPCVAVSTASGIHGVGATSGGLFNTHKQIMGQELPLDTSLLYASYLSSNDSLLVVLSTGELLKVDNYTTSDDLEYNVIGVLPNGIDCAAVDSSEQFLAVVSKSKRLILFSISPNFDIINEVPVSSNERGSEELVTVGWGKKETQFHGTAGKAAALSKEIVIERVQEGDDLKCRLSWRHDQYLAVSAVDETRSILSRKIRVFDNTGRLLSTAEPVTALEWPLAWCSDRNVIAGTQFVATQNRRQVIFFERNGLRHLEFSLTRTCPVKELVWSPSGAYLLVVYSDSVCQLWCTLNYHWYLKAEWTLEHVISAIFVNDQMVVISTFDHIASYNVTSGFTKHKSTVVVVNGHTIGFTPFHIAAVPPPMSYLEHQVDFIPNTILLSDNVCLLQSSLLDCQLLAVDNDHTKCEVIMSGRLPGLAALLVGQNIYSLTGDGKLVDAIGSTTIFEGIVDVKRSEILPNHYLSISANGVNVHDNTFAVLTSIPILKEPNFDQYDVICCKSQYHLISRRGSKLCNGESVILGNVLSCLFLPDFTFITTTAQKMFTLPNDLLHKWSDIVKTDSEESCHFVESGAELLCCDQHEAMLTVVLPRGNLECIYPRAMLLKALRHQIDRLDYQTAYTQCRRHRIDLNILHDHNPPVFMANIKRFITQVKAASWLNLFVTALMEENVAVSKYGGFAGDLVESKANKRFKNKIELVCNAIIQCLSAFDSNAKKDYVETIITAHIKLDQTESALQVLLDISKNQQDERLIEKTIKYMIFLVPAELLYEAALGTYNLPMALTFAKRSQLDPKEYVAVIDALAKCAEPERRFRIDDLLKRHDRAVGHLHEMVKSGERDVKEFLEYVVKTKKFLVAVKAGAGSTVLGLLGDHLAERGLVKDAGVAFALTGDCKYTAFLVKNNLWAQLLLLEPTFTAPADFLKGRPSEYTYYNHLKTVLGDEEKRQFFLKRAIEENQYLDICVLSRGQQQLHHQGLLSAVEKIGEELQSFMERWEPLQLKFTADPIASLTPANLKSTGDGSDTHSELSFAGSILSRTTSAASSKKSRKQQQEKHRLRDKPGSPHERLFLQHAINERIDRLCLVVAEAKPLLEALLLSRQFGEAQELQRELLAKCKLVDDFKSKLDGILAKQKERECMDIMVLRLLLDDAYTMGITLPPSWKDRSFASFLFEY